MAGPPLSSVLDRLAGAGTLPRVADVVRAVARGLVAADGITFVIREDGYCFYAEEDAMSPLWKGQRFPLTACVSGWVMLHNEPAIIPDIYDDPRVPIEAYKPTFVKSLVMMPVGDPPFAAIGAYWAARHDVTENELDILRAIADSAALAIRPDPES